MKTRPHIMIIGAGLMGLSCADSLLRRGAQITIFEKTERAGEGAAQYNSGMIHPSQSEPWISKVEGNKVRAVLKLARRSKTLLMNRRNELNVNDIQRPHGTLKLYESLSLGEQALAQYEAMGIPAVKHSGLWALGRYCLRFPDDRSGDAGHYMRALISDLLRRGCAFKMGHQVILDDKNLRKADKVVLACGAENFKGLQFPIKAVPGHALVFDRPDMDLPDVPIMHAYSHSALTVFLDQLRLSGTVNEESPEVLLDIWKEIAPEIIARIGRPKIKWTASRPASLLGRPIMGPLPKQNWYACMGHGHMGWSLCAASGELMADMIFDGRTAPEFAVP